MRGFKNFKGSDARCPSIHFLFYGSALLFHAIDWLKECYDNMRNATCGDTQTSNYELFI